MKPVALEAYQWPPSTEALARRVGIDPRSIVRFDGNVAAAPPPSARPAALARALADVNEYDRGRYLPLREAIARHHGLEVENVALGAGSDEFIVLVASMFASGGTIATVPAFSYSMYRFAAIMAGATVVDDPATADLVFVCRPNNPTGEMCEIPDVPGQIVVDEAYAQYAGVDALDRLDRGIIILRTFSKAFGLAGARVGYALARPELIEVDQLAPSSAVGVVALGRARTERDLFADRHLERAERARPAGE